MLSFRTQKPLSIQNQLKKNERQKHS